MPSDPVGRTLHFVGMLLLLCGASTPAWWAAANLARTEFRGLMSAIACSMRLFFYSFALFCILYGARTLHWEPENPKSALFRDIHAYGTLLLSFPCAWRAFRVKGPRCALVVLLALALSGAAGAAAWALHPGFREALLEDYAYLIRAR